MSLVSKKFKPKQARKVVHIVLGSASNWQIMLGVVVLVISLGWFTDNLQDMFKGDFKWVNLGAWITFMIFPITLLSVSIWARKISDDLYLRIPQDDHPPKMQAMIIFLSPVGRDEEWLEESVKNIDWGCMTEKSDRERFLGSWRMTIEAIAYHMDRLRTVIVIPSADSRVREDGSFRNIDLFKETINKLLPDGCSINIDVRDPVDYEDADALVVRLQKVYTDLYQEGFNDRDMIVDITGGQKVTTVAGAVISIIEGRRFQYVSTHDYKVRTYDIAYEHGL